MTNNEECSNIEYKVLHGDADINFKELISGYLKSKDPRIVVDIVSSGEELVKKSCSNDYDLILTAEYIGSHLRGITAIKRIRELKIDTPIYFFTKPRTFDNEDTKALESGATGILYKEKEGLDRRLTYIINKHAPK